MSDATPKSVIERIRKRYLVGVELTDEVREGADNLRENLGNSLQLISEDVYAEEAHFLLELVQNADDNQYSSSIVPSLTFDVAPECLRVRNNEKGFVEKNVVALCSVGKSTKNRRMGFIGEKGVGFKSVFSVSDRPEIHSNGYHFRFDRDSGDAALGYVVPHWCADAHSGPGTTIVLPARRTDQFRPELFDRLTEHILLFLRRVKRLSIAIQGASSRDITRSDEGDVARLTTAQGEISSQRAYLLHRHEFSMAGIEEEKRKGISETELVFAFPLEEAKADETFSLFAFLPVREFGFRFLVQGDFLLSTNREDIHRPKPWNRRIRDELANALATALPKLRDNERVGARLLRFVPRKGEIKDEFFKPAAAAVLTRLSGEPCVLGASGTWRKPSEILIADDAFQNLVTTDSAWKLLACEYAHESVLTQPGVRDVLKSLGSQTLLSRHLLALVSNSEWVLEQGPKWLAGFFEYLAERGVDSAVIEKLKRIPCVLLENGTLVAPSTQQLFLPLEGRSSYGFEAELNIVDRRLIRNAKNKERLSDILKKVGVKDAVPAAIVETHILPRYEGDEWADSANEARVGYVRYIKDHADALVPALGASRQAALQHVGKHIYLKSRAVTDDGKALHALAGALYFCSDYEPRFKLERLLRDGAKQERFLSPDYLDNESDDSHKAAWRDFFMDLGVADLAGDSIRGVRGPRGTPRTAWTEWWARLDSNQHLSNYEFGALTN